MPCGILHPMVWGTSVNSLALKTIYFFLLCKLIFWKSTKVGSPLNFPKLMSQLWGIPQPEYFVTSLLEPHQTYFWKHYIYHKEDTKVVVFGFGRIFRLERSVFFMAEFRARLELGAINFHLRPCMFTWSKKGSPFEATTLALYSKVSSYQLTSTEFLITT